MLIIKMSVYYWMKIMIDVIQQLRIWLKNNFTMILYQDKLQ